MDIASLGLKLDTISVEKGNAELDKLVDAAGRAEEAEGKLEEASREAGQAVRELGSAAKETATGVAEMQRTTSQLGESEEEARARIREMVRASLDKQQAMIAAAAATKRASEETERFAQSERRIGSDRMGASFAEAQQELVALSDAMAHQAQSLDDIGERRAWVTELYERGLISLEDTEGHMKALDQQERQLQKSIADHAREVQSLLNTYDPASAAIQKITEDEKRLNEALRSGAISAEQHQKAMAGLNVNRARWRAEAEGVQQVSREINKMAFVSSAAFRDYSTLVGAISRGDMTLAANQFLQLGVRTNALRAAFGVLLNPWTAVAAVAGAFAISAHQGQKEMYELNKSLVLTGNSAGTTAGQIRVIAQEIDGIIGTRGAAIETLNALAATGRVAGEDLKLLGVAAQELKSIGQPVEDTARILADLGRDPLQASLKLNESLHFLTEEMRDQIVEAMRLGDTERAGSIAQNAYANAAIDRARRIKNELPTLNKAAKETGGFFKEMWDEIRGITDRVTGNETDEERLARLRRERGSRPLFSATGTRFFRDLEEDRLAKEAAERQRQADKEREDALKVERDERARRETLQAIQRERQIGDALAGARASSTQRELANSLAQFSAYESQLEAQYQAGLLSAEDYFSERRKLIEQNTAAQIEAIEAEIASIEERNRRTRELAEQELASLTDREDIARVETTMQAQIIAGQAQIADNKDELARLDGERLAQLKVLEIQEDAHGKAISRAYEDARRAAEAYLETIERQRQRELSGFGQGARQREFDAGISEIEDRFTAELRALEDRRSRGDFKDDESQYDRLLALAREFRDRDLAGYEQYWSRREEMEGDFFLGAREAFNNYIDNARNVAAQSEDLFTNAFQGMTEALVEFATTGKTSFKELAQSIIADLLRIQMQAALSQIFGGVFSGLGPSAPIASSTTRTLPVAGARVAHTGEKRVPFHNAPYILSKDEAVLPPQWNPWAGGRSPFGDGPRISFGPTYITGGGLSVAQIDELIKQRNAESEARILQGLASGRYEVSN